MMLRGATAMTACIFHILSQTFGFLEVHQFGIGGNRLSREQSTLKPANSLELDWRRSVITFPQEYSLSWTHISHFELIARTIVVGTIAHRKTSEIEYSEGVSPVTKPTDQRASFENWVSRRTNQEGATEPAWLAGRQAGKRADGQAGRQAGRQ